jgi:hypothetical protein
VPDIETDPVVCCADAKVAANANRAAADTAFTQNFITRDISKSPLQVGWKKWADEPHQVELRNYRDYVRKTGEKRVKN